MKHDAATEPAHVTEALGAIANGVAQTDGPVALACSFSAEDVAVIDLMRRAGVPLRVFALDSGRLHEETYLTAEAVRLHFGIDIRWYFPARDAVEALEREQGLYSFRDSLAARKQCCGIRKVEPLGRALAELAGWITGLRAEQAATRKALAPIESDAAHGGIVKINPLARWTAGQVRDYIASYALPQNKLYQEGYASIGCAPCTRAIRPGEDERAGRWWWEDPEHKECGLHVAPRSGEPK